MGISLLVSSLGILPDPDEEQTVLCILARHLTGDGPFLVLVQVSTALLLTLAANTSFADFPRLSSFLARDGFMPRQFGFRGDRLAFSTGIVALAAVAIVLLSCFEASVSALIPLYTLGVFVAFTLSQSGMVRRWWHRREPGWRRGLVINGLGAVDDRRDRAGRGGQQVHWRRLAGDDHGPAAGRPDVGHPRPLPPPGAGDRAAIHRCASASAGPPPLVIVPIARLDQPSIEALDLRPLDRAGCAGRPHHQRRGGRGGAARPAGRSWAAGRSW